MLQCLGEWPLCSDACVGLEHASEPRATRDFTMFRRRVRARDDQPVADALVRPFVVIVLQVLLDQMIQVLIAEADEVVQALVRDRSYPSLGVGVHDRRAPGGCLSSYHAALSTS